MKTSLSPSPGLSKYHENEKKMGQNIGVSKGNG